METRCFFLPPSSPISLWEPTVFGLSLPSLGDQRAALHRLALTEELWHSRLCYYTPPRECIGRRRRCVGRCLRDASLVPFGFVPVEQLDGDEGTTLAIPAMSLFVLASPVVSDMALLAWIKAVRFDVSVILFDCGNMIRSSELSTSLKRSADHLPPEPPTKRRRPTESGAERATPRAKRNHRDIILPLNTTEGSLMTQTP
ncbi:hypothetical protein CPB85DRAFT_1567748 [Mucidula mucida]|nr:hypothetical protein CPB85DRAFT_1567748 [Mucidula mucida]